LFKKYAPQKNHFEVVLRAALVDHAAGAAGPDQAARA